MLTKSEAIVLHTLKYGESRLIIDLFTREHGRLSCIMTRGKGARSRGPLLQPLSLLDMELDVRPRVQLQQVRNVRMLQPYGSLPFEPAKTAVVMFLSEFLYHALRGEQQPDEQLFDYMKHSFLLLDTAQERYANFHLVFLMHLSRFLGYDPQHHDFQKAEDAACMQTLMGLDFDNMHELRMKHQERNRYLDILLAYYHQHLPSFPELKSLDVLQELFA